MALSPSQITTLAEHVGWPSDQIPTLLGIIGAESGGDPNVVAWGSGSTVLGDSSGWPPPVTGYDEAAVGLTQELLYPASAVTPQAIKQLQNPETNLAVALQKYQSSGWRPWQGDAYVNSHPELLGEKPGQTGGGSNAQLTSFDWNPLSWVQSLGNVSQQAGQDVGSWLSGGLSSGAKDALGFTGGAIASGLSGAVSAITGTSGPTELGMRFIEVIAGALLFGLGIFALVYAASGKTVTGSGGVGAAAKGGAALTAAALIPK